MTLYANIYELRAGLECVDKYRRYATGQERGWQFHAGGIEVVLTGEGWERPSPGTGR